MSPPTGPSEVLIYKVVIAVTVAVWTAHIVPVQIEEGSCAWYQFAVVLPLAFVHSIGCSHAQISLVSAVCTSLLSEVILVCRRTTFVLNS